LGVSAWYPIPDDVRGKIGRVITLYDQAVANEEPFKDILGPLCEALASHGGKQMLGQFFTPWSLASLMVRMSDGDIDLPRAGDLKAYSDPACGSGVMLLAKANYLLETKGPGELQQWLFHRAISMAFALAWLRFSWPRIVPFIGSKSGRS
jgi:type I restriction-modification system DNA methylase subunit